MTTLMLKSVRVGDEHIVVGGLQVGAEDVLTAIEDCLAGQDPLVIHTGDGKIVVPFEVLSTRVAMVEVA